MTSIITLGAQAPSNVQLFGPDGGALSLVGSPEPVVQAIAEEEPASLQEQLEQLAQLKAQLAAQLKAPLAALKAVPVAAKNKVRSEVHAARSYSLLTETLAPFGKVPQQQKDLAELMAACFPVGEEFTEAELFSALEKLSFQYPSLANSKQHVTYLFRYYRGLKNDGRHAGFVARGFLRQIG
jgi:hypothetical protein